MPGSCRDSLSLPLTARSETVRPCMTWLRLKLLVFFSLVDVMFELGLIMFEVELTIFRAWFIMFELGVNMFKLGVIVNQYWFENILCFHVR